MAAAWLLVRGPDRPGLEDSRDAAASMRGEQASQRGSISSDTRIDAFLVVFFVKLW